jgi:hypothetical protein
LISLPAEINFLVEGRVDAAIARRLISHVGAIPGLEKIAGGKSKLDPLLSRYHQSAARLPWLIMRDLDHDAECGPSLKQRLLPTPAELLCFRIVVREAEAWLMYDVEALASFLKISDRLIPRNPENLDDAKLTLVNLARRSKSSSIRTAMTPRSSSGATEGPEFSASLAAFVDELWRPDVAVGVDNHSSLARTVRCLAVLSARVDLLQHQP